MAFADFDKTQEITLTTRGRASGRESSRPVWFVRDGEALYLLPITGSDSQWYKNALRTPAIRLSARGAEEAGQATPITDAAKVAEVIERFSAKYGASNVERYYPKRDVAVEVQPIGA